MSPIGAAKYAHQAQKLSLDTPEQDNNNGAGTAVEARFITPHDPVVILEDGGRLPGVPLAEAEKLNSLKEEVGAGSEHAIEESPEVTAGSRAHLDKDTIQRSGEGSLRKSMPPSRTNPLFPPLPLYGPSSLMRDIQCYTFRASSFVLSLGFLGIIVLGSGPSYFHTVFVMSFL
jgi:hypothetical protein